MSNEGEVLVGQHAKSLLDLVNRGSDEISAVALLNERLAAWGPQVNREHFQAVTSKLEKLSTNTNDKLPSVEIIDHDGDNKPSIEVKDFNAQTTQKLAAKAVDKFFTNRDEQVFSDMKKKLSHDDYQDFLADSNKILKQISNGRKELNLADGSDEDNRADQVYGVVVKPELARKQLATKGGERPTQQQKLDALEKMPATLANSEAGANLAWEAFFNKE
ncbi:MAG: hypothetical protein K2X77_26425 [Candidatus Obscuribacterales bacterium]|jgi:hypothetical protein|nr:hypothetical protein [Candidatus Obscuribacterales bacterium]